MSATIPIACSLEQADRPRRIELLAELGRSLVAVDADGLQASLRFDSGPKRLKDFVRAESECCPFFDFAIDEGPASITLSVGAPEGGEFAIRGLVAGFVAGWGALV
jgi:hypothetical protein